MRLITILASILIYAATAMAQDTPSNEKLVAAAEAAFQAGNSTEAVKIYDQLLASDPKNVAALLRSGLLLSWQSKFPEAISRYDRVLAIEPGNPTAQIERAKVLSWSKQYGRAIEAYNKILAKDPTNAEAQIGLARVLSWSGSQDAAREQYMKIFTARPSDVDAMVGVAQTYAWSGQQKLARDWYGKALAAQPERREAVLGLAYLDLGSGDVSEANRKTKLLESRFPNDKDIAELRIAVNRVAAPTFRLTYDGIEDTDDNRMNTFGASGRFSFPQRSELTLNVRRFNMEDSEKRKAEINSVLLTFTNRPTPSQRLSLGVGTDLLSPTTGDDSSKFTWSANYALGVGERVEANLLAERNSYRYTTRGVDAGIFNDSYSATLGVNATSRIRLNATASLWNISDGNERVGADFMAWYRWNFHGARLGAAYGYHYFDYDQDLNNGYFDPQNFSSNSILLSFARDIRNFYIDASVESGVQSFTVAGVETSNDQFHTEVLLLGYKMTNSAAFEVVGIHSDSAVANPAGFESNQISARLRLTAAK